MGLESSVGPGPLVPAPGSSVSDEGAVVFLSADADARSEASVVVESPPSTPGVSALEGAMVVEVESFSNISVSGVSTSTASPDELGVGLVEVVGFGSPMEPASTVLGAVVGAWAKGTDASRPAKTTATITVNAAAPPTTNRTTDLLMSLPA